MSRGFTHDPRIYTREFVIRAVDCEEERIEEVVGRTARIPVGVLDVAAQLSSRLQAMLAVGD